MSNVLSGGSIQLLVVRFTNYNWASLLLEAFVFLFALGGSVKDSWAADRDVGRERRKNGGSANESTRKNATVSRKIDGSGDEKRCVHRV